MWEGLLFVSSPRQQHNKTPLEDQRRGQKKMADNVSLAVATVTSQPKLLLAELTASLRPRPRLAAVLHLHGWSHRLSGGGGRGLRERASH